MSTTTADPIATEWSHITLPGPTPLVRRDSLQVGDYVQSSHGYKGYVVTADTRGTGEHGGTTYLTLELHAPGSGVRQMEAYPADTRIPLLKREAPDQGLVNALATLLLGPAGPAIVDKDPMGAQQALEALQAARQGEFDHVRL